MRQLGTIVVLHIMASAVSTCAVRPCQQKLRRRLQEIATPYHFNISLALEYLEPTVATQLESDDITNEVLAHFCSSVNTQASGTQVQTYAQALSVEIETRIAESAFGTDYDCTVLATNRVYDETGEALFASGVLALEITVRQVVYITGELSEFQTNNILESGFNRGDGGRIKFRELLQEHSAFGKLINVEVIEGPVAPIQLADDPFPSGEVLDSQTSQPAATAPPPSLAPSAQASSSNTTSTPVPSFVPTDMVSDMPSHYPTLVLSSKEESSSPTVEATAGPTMVALPTPAGDNADSTTQFPRTTFNRRQPLILGAIFGGVATIFVSCFFIFCVWFPFCGNNKRRLPRPPTYERSDPASSASSTDLYGDTAVPSTLHLDSDSQSQTYLNTTIRPGEKRQRDRTETAESFDESSIYTSTFAAGTTENRNFLASPKLSAAELFVDAHVGIEEEDPNDAISAFEVESSVGSASSLMAANLSHDGHEEAKEEIEFATRSTKGFDPFSDDSDSSFGLAGSLAASDPSFGTQVNDISRYSPSSMKTKRTDNLVLRVETNVMTSADGSIEVEEGKDDGNSILENSDIYESSQTSRNSSISDIASSTSLANNALLRSVLENARRRERSGGSSRVSLKSAPSRVTRLQEPKRRSVRLMDHLASDKVRTNGRGASSRSIGVRSLVSFSEARQSKRSSYNSDQSSGLPMHNHALFGSPDLASPFGSYASIDYGSGKATSASSDIGTSIPRLYQDSWDGVEEKDSLVSSPGVLGIASISDGTPSDIEGMPDIDRISYPWLFEGDNEEARSSHHERTNSISSTWSARSHISGGSVSTNSIQDWTPKKSNSGRPPRPHGPSSDDRESTTSRTLEHDLSRLRDVPSYRRSGARTVNSTVSAPSASSIKSAPYRNKGKKQRLQVVAPPGKIGVVLSNRLHGRGTYISEVRPSSTLRHYVRPGDKLVAIDGEDVSSVSVTHITDIMQSKASLERRLTLITAQVTDEATFHSRS